MEAAFKRDDVGDSDNDEAADTNDNDGDIDEEEDSGGGEDDDEEAIESVPRRVNKEESPRGAGKGSSAPAPEIEWV